MTSKVTVIAALIVTSITATSCAMMNGGQPGTGMGGWNAGGTTGIPMVGGHTGAGWVGTGPQSPGPGAGMMGAGRFKSGMHGQIMKNAFLDVLAPFTTPQDAITAIETYIAAANSTLQVSDVWEYQTVYKAELSDVNGQKAFDVAADKLTGSVLPEMGFSMMMNASWGKQLQITPKFGKRTLVTPEAAAAAVGIFLAKNVDVIDYTITAQEAYPGFYKFHTVDGAGNPGMDIMVNGYNGGIWMNTQLGAPITKIQ